MSSGLRAPGGGRKSSTNLASVGDSSLSSVRPPKDLINEKAKEMWKSQSAIMIEKGTLSREDLPVLLAYCNSFAHLLIIEEKIVGSSEVIGTGYFTETPTGGLKKHPALNVRNDMIAQVRSLGSLLGLDPMSRLRMLGSGKEPEGDGNDFDEF